MGEQIESTSAVIPEKLDSQSTEAGWLTKKYHTLLVSLGLRESPWDPAAKARWEEAEKRGINPRIEDSPPGFVREYVNACILAAKQAEREVAATRWIGGDKDE